MQSLETVCVSLPCRNVWQIVKTDRPVTIYIYMRSGLLRSRIDDHRKLAVDCNHLENVGNVLVDGEPTLTLMEALKIWAELGKSMGQHFWMQLNHAGRQTPLVLKTQPDSFSDVQLKNIPGHNLENQSQ